MRALKIDEIPIVSGGAEPHADGGGGEGPPLTGWAAFQAYGNVGMSAGMANAIALASAGGAIGVIPSGPRYSNPDFPTVEEMLPRGPLQLNVAENEIVVPGIRDPNDGPSRDIYTDRGNLGELQLWADLQAQLQGVNQAVSALDVAARNNALIERGISLLESIFSQGAERAEREANREARSDFDPNAPTVSYAPNVQLTTSVDSLFGLFPRTTTVQAWGDRLHPHDTWIDSGNNGIADIRLRYNIQQQVWYGTSDLSNTPAANSWFAMPGLTVTIQGRARP